MCVCVYLDLLDAVDDEHVLQVLHGSVHPVVERRCPLGKLQVQLVDGLPQLLHALGSEVNTGSHTLPGEAASPQGANSSPLTD